MGGEQVELVRRYGLAEGQTLDLDKAEYKGLVDTNCLNNYVTDSAAAATAMATGVRTLYERMGMDENGNELETILDIAHNNGLMTGLITNDFLTGATPGGFSAHSINRDLNKKDRIKTKHKIFFISFSLLVKNLHLYNSTNETVLQLFKKSFKYPLTFYKI